MSPRVISPPNATSCRTITTAATMRAGSAIARARALHIAQSVHAALLEWPRVCRGTNDTRLGVPGASRPKPEPSIQRASWGPRCHRPRGRGDVVVPPRGVLGQALSDSDRLRPSEVSLPEQSGGPLRAGPCPPRLTSPHEVPGHENGISGRRPDALGVVLGLDVQARGGGPGGGGNGSRVGRRSLRLV